MDKDWDDYWNKHPGRVISGVCKCGHDFYDHHGSMVVNATAYESQMRLYPKMGGRVGDECEFFGCNEDGGKDAEGNPHCYRYEDSET